MSIGDPGDINIDDIDIDPDADVDVSPDVDLRDLGGDPAGDSGGNDSGVDVGGGADPGDVRVDVGDGSPDPGEVDVGGGPDPGDVRVDVGEPGPDPADEINIGTSGGGRGGDISTREIERIEQQARSAQEQGLETSDAAASPRARAVEQQILEENPFLREEDIAVRSAARGEEPTVEFTETGRQRFGTMASMMTSPAGGFESVRGGAPGGPVSAVDVAIGDVARDIQTAGGQVSTVAPDETGAVEAPGLFERAGVSQPAGGMGSVRGAAPGPDDPSGIFVGVGVSRRTEPIDTPTETVGAAGPMGVTVPADREPGLTAEDVWGFVSRDVSGPPGPGVPSGQGQDVPRELPGQIFSALTAQPEEPPGVGVLNTPPSARSFAEIIPGGGTFEGPVDVPEGAPGPGVPESTGTADDFMGLMESIRESLEPTEPRDLAPPEDADRVVGAAGPLGVPAETEPGLTAEGVWGAATAFAAGLDEPVTGEPTEAVPEGAPGAGVLPGTGSPEDLQRFLGAPVGAAMLARENVEFPGDLEPGAPPERQATQRDLFRPEPAGPFTGTTVSEAIGQTIDETVVTEEEAASLPQRQEQFGDFDPTIFGIAVEPTLQRASIGTRDVAETVGEETGEVFGTAAGQFSRGAIEAADPFGIALAGLETAELGAFLGEGLVEGEFTDRAAELGIATAAAAPAAAEFIEENPFRFAGGASTALVGGVAAGRFIERIPGTVRAARIRARGGEIFEFEDLSDPPVITEGFNLPGFTRQAQRDPVVAREEFLQQARANVIGGDVPVAFHGRSPEAVSQFGGFGRRFVAPEGGSELPGLFQSADLSPLRVGQGTGSGGLSIPSLGLPQLRLRGARVLAEEDIDVGITRGRTGAEVAEFLEEQASRERSFIRTEGGGPTPEQEVIAPPGAVFEESGGIFGVRVGRDVIPGRLMRRGDPIEAAGEADSVPLAGMAEETTAAISESLARQTGREPFVPAFGFGTGVTGGELLPGESAGGIARLTRTDVDGPPARTTAAVSEPATSLFSGTFESLGMASTTGSVTAAGGGLTSLFSGGFSNPTRAFGGTSSRPTAASERTTSATSGASTSRPASGSSGPIPSNVPTAPGSTPSTSGRSTGTPSPPPSSPGAPFTPFIPGGPGTPIVPRLPSDRGDRGEREEFEVPPAGQEFQNPIASGMDFLFGRQAGDFGTASVFGDLGGEAQADDIMQLFGGGR